MRTIAFVCLMIFLIATVSCEEGMRAGGRPNSPPTITAVNIVPDRPVVENDLSVMILSQDPDGDPVVYSYQWIRNEEAMAGENKAVLKSGNFKKGDSLRVKVTPSDSNATGIPFSSSPVKVINSSPSVQAVRIEPRLAYIDDRLKALVTGNDRDGDFVYYSYQWEKNGVILANERSETLDAGHFQKGDSISVTVTPDDREVLGLPKRSDPDVILNSAPMIASSPPISIKGTSYVYQVNAIDPDNDPVGFVLKMGPKGMEIDRKTGLIRWETHKDDQGTHSVEIEASDNAGARSVQRYKLAVEVKK